MPRYWRARCSDYPDSALYDPIVAAAQSDEFICNIEAQTYNVQVSLGRFDDGTFFLWLECPDLKPITPTRFLEGTFFEGCPFHVTLGWPTRWVDFEELETRVTGTFGMTLTKWTEWRESTTYLPRGGVGDVCAQCEQMGFAPRGEWHVSM